MLTRDEVAGVMAHELAHIKNHDTLTMTITATIAGAISMLAQFGMFFGGNRGNNQSGGMGIIGTLALVILAPHRRHDRADGDQPLARICRRQRRAREICGRPVCARVRARQDRQCRPCRSRTRRPKRNPATAHMFIINPLSGQRMDNLFSTHPATENRIAALEQLAMEMGQGGFSAVRQHRNSYPPGRRPACRAARSWGPWGQVSLAVAGERAAWFMQCRR